MWIVAVPHISFSLSFVRSTAPERDFCFWNVPRYTARKVFCNAQKQEPFIRSKGHFVLPVTSHNSYPSHTRQRLDMIPQPFKFSWWHTRTITSPCCLVATIITNTVIIKISTQTQLIFPRMPATSIIYVIYFIYFINSTFLGREPGLWVRQQPTRSDGVLTCKKVFVLKIDMININVILVLSLWTQ